ncbi:MAG: aldo/keto reductase [Acidobacteriota bacterium]|nr:aldo/keto reductase [Acidobacteriota bacterium]
MITHRTFGYTGVDVSILGIGGYHLGSVKTQTEAIRIVHEAIDRGINFFDNAWDYHDGKAEERMGKALKGRRHEVLLMTRVCTHGRDKKTGMRQLHQSLKRLQTDHLDVWQIHEVIYANEPSIYFRPGGAVEALEEAKRAGKVRFIGFTGHKDPAIHLEMLSHEFPFDTCQLPLNCFDAGFRSFEQRVLPELHRQRITPIGMKSLGGEGIPIKKRAVKVADALRYAMSLPVGTTVSGIDSMKVLLQNLRIATNFQPMREDEMRALRQQTAENAADGHFELYKTSMKNDGPEGRRVHGIPSEEEMTA